MQPPRKNASRVGYEMCVGYVLQLVQAVDSWVKASSSSGSIHESITSQAVTNASLKVDQAMDQVVQIMSEELAWAHSIHWTSKGFR